ncbi:MAG TPA: ion transporter, partial [Cyclobacteriaceae bacterium]|nr:ion transporter [Cyclobacteriaceae bacterium]
MSAVSESKEKLAGWKLRVYEIIFESDTPAGKAFDVGLLISIVLSIIVVMLESVQSIKSRGGEYFIIAEWFFTILFTLEYLGRLWVVLNKRKFIFSFFGIVDL